MTSTFSVSRSDVVPAAGGSVVWFAIAVAMATSALPAESTGSTIARAVLWTGFALLPAIRFAWRVIYRITIDEEFGECEFRCLLRRRSIRILQVRAFEWKDGEITVVHDGGAIKIPLFPQYREALARFLEINPGIHVSDGLRGAILRESEPLEVPRNQVVNLVRENPLGTLVWLIAIWFMVFGLFVAENTFGWPWLPGALIAVPLGTLAWWLVMYAFAKGWIGDE